MKKAGIKTRVGTANRLFHWFLYNRLGPLSRRKPTLHEAQLHLKLLRGIGIDVQKSLEQLPDYFGLDRVPQIDPKFKHLLSNEKFNLIIHPKSGGNAPAGDLQHYAHLIQKLDLEKTNILINGSATEKKQMQKWTNFHQGRVTDISGMFSLEEFMSFGKSADGLVAWSIGPVHVAAPAEFILSAHIAMIDLRAPGVRRREAD